MWSTVLRINLRSGPAFIYTIIPVLLVFAENRSEKRALGNYVVSTSVPYTVQEPTTSNPYDRLPQRNSLADRIVVNHDHTSQETSNDEPSVEGTFRPYSQDELNKILKKYEKVKEQDGAQLTSNKVANYYSGDAGFEPADETKPKSWNLIRYHQQPNVNNYNGNSEPNQNSNKNPYDDRTGWVTLEPIAWSASQIQKWHPNSKPSRPVPSIDDNLLSGPPSLMQQQQQQSQQQTTFGGYADRPYKRPTYQYHSKPWNSRPQQQTESSFGNQEIITDGQPGYFPAENSDNENKFYHKGGVYKPWLEQSASASYNTNLNRPSHLHSSDHQTSAESSSDGNGHWILLSSTKGYSAPHRQHNNFRRSIDLNEEASVQIAPVSVKPQRSVSNSRSINLTVVSPQEITITSNSGLVGVGPSTSQPIDDAHREHSSVMMQEEVPTIETYWGVPNKLEAVLEPHSTKVPFQMLWMAVD